jgi:murein DD-endopeptidase MepM/ murein hydrolase activator NlpD
LERANDGEMRRFEYEIDADRFLRLSREPAGDWLATVLPIPKTRRLETVRGTIDRQAPSLVAAVDAAGETIDLTLALADIFGGDIDFNTELQPGDRFELTVEKQLRDGDAFAGYGPIAAAEFNNAGRRIRAVRFTDADGKPAHYDERGRFDAPLLPGITLKFQPVVTSAFRAAAFTPILREYRRTRRRLSRVTGAAVVAVSDGVVVSAGSSGGSGRMVHRATRTASSRNICTSRPSPCTPVRACVRASSSVASDRPASRRVLTSTID